MNRWNLSILLMPAIVLAAAPVWSQSVVTDGNVETDAQLVSNVVTGTAPLAVSSTTVVPNLNVDQVDGLDASAFALDTDLQNVELLLLALGTAQVPRTGQTTCYDVAGLVTACGTGIGLGQDGDLQLGVTWPNPRFTDNGDGTVTDNLTGLIWLGDADCFGGRTWTDALSDANGLSDGFCGLTDGSVVGEWRLPNVRELQSLVHYGVSSPAVPNTAGTGKWTAGDPFSDVQSASYWSSTTFAPSTDFAWDVGMVLGNPINGHKASSFRVWPVRGGQ